MDTPRRRPLRTALKALVSCSLLAWVGHTIASREGVDALLARLADLSGGWLGVAAALQLAAVAAGIARFRMLLESQGQRLPLPFLARTFLVGRFIGAFTPSTTGLDLYRVVAVRRRTGDGGPVGRTVVLEKLFGLLALSLVTLALLPLGAGRFFGGPALVATAGLGVVCAGGLFAVYRPGALSPLARCVPGVVRAKLGASLVALRARPLDRPAAAQVFALGLAGHLLTAGVFVATAAALRVEVASLDVLVTGVAIVLATLLPLSVGGVGVREGTAVVLLGAVGVPATDAMLVALLGYLTAQPPALLGGLWSLLPETLPTLEHPAAGQRSAQWPVGAR